MKIIGLLNIITKYIQYIIENSVISKAKLLKIKMISGIELLLIVLEMSFNYLDHYIYIRIHRYIDTSNGHSINRFDILIFDDCSVFEII